MSIVFQTNLADRIVVSNGGVAKFDTDLKSFGLLDSAKYTNSALELAYDDLVKSDGYYWHGQPEPNGFVSEEAYAFITAPPQKTQDDTLICTVPAGTDYLDVQCAVTRTKDPSQILGGDILPRVKLGHNLSLYGGSCLLEKYYPLVRGFTIVLDGTNVYLRRWQNTPNAPKFFGFSSTAWAAGNSTTVGGVSWGSNGKGWPLAMVGQSTGLSGSGYVRQRGQSAAAPLTDTTDYASTYSLDITITPGNYNVSLAPPLPTTPYLNWTDTDSQASNSSTYTSAAKNIGYETPTRKVIAIVRLSSTNLGSQVSIGSATLGGVTMTRVALGNHYANSGGSSGLQVVVAIYIVDAPTSAGLGEEADFVQHLGAGLKCYSVELFAAYNLTSNTPVANPSNTTTGSSTLSVATHNGGVAVGCVVGISSIPTLSGIDNIDSDSVAYLGSGTTNLDWIYGFEGETDGSTLSLSCASSSFGAAAAASFQ